MTTAEAMPASWDSETCRCATPSSAARAGDGAAHDDVRAAVLAALDGRVGPVQPDGRAERLGERLLGGEAGGERAHAAARARPR